MEEIKTKKSTQLANEKKNTNKNENKNSHSLIRIPMISTAWKITSYKYS